MFIIEYYVTQGIVEHVAFTTSLYGIHNLNLNISLSEGHRYEFEIN